MNNPSTESVPESNSCIPQISLVDFIESLKEIDHPSPLHAIRELLGRLELSEEDLKSFGNFDKEKYCRNLVSRDENFEVLLLCFESGQRTPIHDHAGSACGVKVIQGEGVETVFKKSDGGWLYPTGSHRLPKNGVVGSVDMDIHRLSNLQGMEGRLITLHVYSPPLGEVSNYSIDDNSVVLVKAAERL